MKTLAISVAFVLVSAICAAQGLTITSKTTSSDGATTTETGYISGDHVRWASPDGEIIIDGKTGSMTTINNKKKTYFVTTRQDIDAMAAKIKEKMNSPEMQRMREAMKSLPPEQQKRMGGMFDVKVEKATGSRTIAGYKCENWTVSMGQMSRTEECVTTDLKFPPQAWQMYRDFAASMKSLMAAMGPMGANMKTMQDEFAKMRGFPLASSTTVSVMGRTSVTSNEVTGIKSGPIPASAWEIPAGYTKVENPMRRELERGR